MAKYANGFDAAADYRIKQMHKRERHHAEGLHTDRPDPRCPDCERATQSEQSHTEEK